MATKSTGVIPTTNAPTSTIGDPGLVKDQVKAVPVIKPVDLFVKGRVPGMAGE